MTPVTLDMARWQFALTAGAHFMFVALTLGLALVLAILQTIATTTRDPVQAQRVRFWGQLYVINYAMGIVTGLVMEFQFGLAWSGLMDFAGNVFGPPIAMETIIAFFAESTFLGLWIFGWHRLNRWAHLALIWLVTITAFASAYFIMVANGFLHRPMGYRENGGELELADLRTLLTNPNSLNALEHITGAALVTVSFFLAGVSAYHLRRGNDPDFFRPTLRIGVFLSFPALLYAASAGGESYAASPRFDDDNAGVSAAAFTEGTMIGVWLIMVFISMASVLLASFRPAVLQFRPWHRVLIWTIPLPFLALASGWIFRETGRQPWTIYGLLRTEDAVSPMSQGTMLGSLIAFVALIGTLVVINYTVLARSARKGPDGAVLGRSEPEPEPLPAARY